ncbi:hypothetical protein UFOVP1376_55, partial [uncultured Caudovirales phage]
MSAYTLRSAEDWLRFAKDMQAIDRTQPWEA